MDRNYGGVIWTNHALQRLSDRGISQSDALYTFQKPQQSRYASAKEAWIYYRTYKNEQIEVVAKQNDKKEWIILSVWSKPNFTKTAVISSKKKGFLKYFFEQLLGKSR